MTISKKILDEIASRAEAGDGLAMDYSARMQRANYERPGKYVDTSRLKSVLDKSETELAKRKARLPEGHKLISSGEKRLEKDRQTLEKGLMQQDNFKRWFGDSKVSEGGVPKTVYHGTNKDINEFNTGRIWAADAETANTYTGDQKGSTVYPLNMAIQNPLEYDAQGLQYNQLEYNGEKISTDELADIAEEMGHDGLIIKNLRDANTDDGGEIASTHYAVFDPSNIRSTNAAFDPAKKDSSNLLASLGAGTVAAGGLLASDESEAGSNKYIASDARYGELGEIKNPDGSTSTEFSITEFVPELGGWVNMPSLVEGQVGVRGLLDGEQITREQMGIAIRRAISRVENGATLPSYSTIDEALKAAESRTPEEKYKPYMNKSSALGGLAAKPTYNAIDDLFAGGELASNLVGSTLLSLGEESLSGLKALGTGDPYARVDLPDYPFPVSSERGQEMQQSFANAIAPYAEDLNQFSNEWADEGAQYDPAIGAVRRTLFETPIVGDALGLIGGLGDTVSSSWDELTDYARQDRLRRGR